MCTLSFHKVTFSSGIESRGVAQERVLLKGQWKHLAYNRCEVLYFAAGKAEVQLASILLCFWTEATPPGLEHLRPNDWHRSDHLQIMCLFHATFLFKLYFNLKGKTIIKIQH